MLQLILVDTDVARNEETQTDLRIQAAHVPLISHMIKWEDEEDAGERCKVIELKPVLKACGSEITIATCECTKIGITKFRRWLLTFSRRYQDYSQLK